MVLSNTVEPRFNEPLFNEALDITNVPAKVTVKCMEKNLDITNPPFNKQIWPVPSDFVKSRFHCILILFKFWQLNTLNSMNLGLLFTKMNLLIIFLVGKNL